MASMDLFVEKGENMEVINNSAPEFEQLLPAIMYIEQNCTEEIKISHLAMLCSMDESTFKKSFEQFTGSSVIGYKNRIRMEKAYTLIIGKHCSVADAAKSVGFDNLYYFSRLFKSIMGVSPRSLINEGKTDSDEL